MIKKAIVESIKKAHVVELVYDGANVVKATIKVPEVGLVDQKVIDDFKVLITNKVKQGFNFKDRIDDLINLVYHRFGIILDPREVEEFAEKVFIPEKILYISKYFNTLIVKFQLDENQIHALNEEDEPIQLLELE